MKQTGRLQFIDLHRGLAILVMIEVHVFNAFLNPAYRSEPWFKDLNFVNGLVAPSFLFISGFAFILAAEKKYNDFKLFRSAFWKQLGRIALIWFVGYSLRIPFFSLKKSLYHSSEQQITAFLSVDVLQTIAVGLLLLFGLRMLISNLKAFHILIAALAVLAGVVAPWFWNNDFHSKMPAFFANYLNPQQGSLFPLFPWIGFLFSGAWLALLFQQARSKNAVDSFFKTTAIISLIMIVSGHLFIAKQSITHIPLPDPHFFFYTMRVGYVIAILWACYAISEKTDVSRWFFIDASRESLLIYWLHLQVIYRKLTNDKSLEEMINFSLTVWQGVIATIILIALMLVVAKYWGKFKKLKPDWARNFAYSFLGIPVVIFLFR